MHYEPFFFMMRNKMSSLIWNLLINRGKNMVVTLFQMDGMIWRRGSSSKFLCILIKTLCFLMQYTFLNLLVNPWLWNTFMSISKMPLRQMGLDSVVQVIMNNVFNVRSTSDLGTNKGYLNCLDTLINPLFRSYD